MAALSPDGRAVAYSVDGRTVLEVPVAGGKPHAAFDLSSATIQVAHDITHIVFRRNNLYSHDRL